MVSTLERNSSLSKNVPPVSWSKRKACGLRSTRGRQHVIGSWRKHFVPMRKKEKQSHRTRWQSAGESKIENFWPRTSGDQLQRKPICAIPSIQRDSGNFPTNAPQSSLLLVISADASHPPAAPFDREDTIATIPALGLLQQSRCPFTFNPQFTDETAGHPRGRLRHAAHEREEGIHSQRNLRCWSTEVLVALSCENRPRVDEFVRKALAAGGSTSSDPKDYGFMYVNEFQHLDGHIREVFHLESMPPQQERIAIPSIALPSRQ
jgi:uncharacterized protein